MKNLAIASLLAVPFFAAGQTGRYELANANVLLALDGGGKLVELTNRATGHRYAAAGRAPWRMYYRLGTPLTGALDLEIDPGLQSGRVRREDNALVIAYDSLKGAAPKRGETRDLRIGLEVRVALEGDRLIWTGRIASRESDPAIEITELWLPWIYGIGDMGLGRPADTLYWPERAGRRIRNPYAQMTTARREAAPSFRGGEPSLTMTYPFPASMQWYTFNDGEEGLYFGSHDQTLMTTCLNVMAHADQALSATVVKYPFVKGGETWTSQPVVLRLYRGDWHAAAHTYRAWADTWMTKPDPPRWLRRSPGWVLPSMKGQTGRINSVYADLPATYQEAHSAGIPLLNLFGWVKQGFDNLYPEYDPDEALGGEKGLKAALAEVQHAGGKTILYTQGQLIDPSTEYYRKEGRSIVARDIWGYEYRESYGGGGQGTLLNVMRNKYFGIACPGAKGWIEHLEWQLGLVQGLGAQGIIFDQMGGIPPYICFSKDHPHAKPSLAVGPEKVRNMKRLRALMKARDPEFAFVIELGTDCYAGLVDIIHSHGIGFWPEPEAFGEMLRYTFPEPLITNRGGGPYDRRMQLGHAFALGWRFDANLRDVRDGGFFKRLVELRNAHPEELLEGRFVDNEGFRVEGTGDRSREAGDRSQETGVRSREAGVRSPETGVRSREAGVRSGEAGVRSQETGVRSRNSGISSHAFVAGNRMAVTLWNPGETAETVQVTAPGYRLETAEWQDPGWSGVGHSIGPKDVAVFIFRRE